MLLIKNRYLDGLLHLLFPDRCIVCSCELARTERMLCSICFAELSRTYFERVHEPTELDKLFWGRISVTATYALYYYQKHNTVQPVVQAIKYKNRPDVGVFFGRLLGEQLKTLPLFSTVDVLIPTPIHSKKRYIRGYNQTEKLIEGIVSVWGGRVVDKHTVTKAVHTGSQTKLKKFGRWDNVENGFIAHPSIQQYQHVAIVDDVITTGATLESIMQSILSVAPTIQISVVGLALTV